MKKNTKAALAASAAALVLACASSAYAQYVVQIPVDSVLDGRAVITLTGGAVVPFGNKQGIYSGGTTGYATAAVQTMLAPTSKGVGLPDDGFFPATGNLPAFQLHFSNAAPATSPQTHQLPASATTGAQTFQFPVPPASYTALYLILASGDGTASFTVTLSYAGGTPSTMTTITNLPDSGLGVQMGGPPHFYIVTNTGKWSNTNTDLEPTGHTIEGVEITPSPAPAILTGVTVTKTNGAILVFWGATGIATTPVDGGTEESSDSDGGGPEGGGAPLDASTGSASGASSGAETSSGTGSGTSASGVTSGSPTSGSASAGTVSGATDTGSAGTTSAGTSGSASSSGSNASGSNATTSSSSGKSGSGCSFAPTGGTGAGWVSLAALALLVRARRRPKRRCVATNAQRSAR
jgi:MYXO-CTERM domain-containing protein